MVTPSSSSGFIAVQFYPQPTHLQRIQVLTSTGQLVKEIIAKNGGDNYYGIDLSEKADGIYIVRALFTDSVLIKKIVKQ